MPHHKYPKSAKFNIKTPEQAVPSLCLRAKLGGWPEFFENHGCRTMDIRYIRRKDRTDSIDLSEFAIPTYAARIRIYLKSQQFRTILKAVARRYDRDCKRLCTGFSILNPTNSFTADVHLCMYLGRPEDELDYVCVIRADILSTDADNHTDVIDSFETSIAKQRFPVALYESEPDPQADDQFIVRMGISKRLEVVSPKIIHIIIQEQRKVAHEYQEGVDEIDDDTESADQTAESDGTGVQEPDGNPVNE